MAEASPSVDGIMTGFPNTIIPQINGEPTYQQLYEVHRMLMENASSIEATFGCGLHRHLGLVITPAQYLQVTGNNFALPANPRPTPVMPWQFMAAADAETVQQQHRADLIAYTKYNIVDKALKNQLLSVINSRYTKALQQGMFGLNNPTTHDILEHLYTNYGYVTPHMMTQADTHIRQAFNPSLPMEDFFEQFDVAQDLCTAGHNPYLDVQLFNIRFDLIFRTAVHNDACKEWLR
eukprot:15340340-Ditylum_brightwellii.AAC.1